MVLLKILASHGQLKNSIKCADFTNPSFQNAGRSRSPKRRALHCISRIYVAYRAFTPPASRRPSRHLHPLLPGAPLAHRVSSHA
eukprot:2632521-Pleurochrysis_carterae.AAC.1